MTVGVVPHVFHQFAEVGSLALIDNPADGAHVALVEHIEGTHSRNQREFAYVALRSLHVWEAEDECSLSVNVAESGRTHRGASGENHIAAEVL